MNSIVQDQFSIDQFFLNVGTHPKAKEVEICASFLFSLASNSNLYLYFSFKYLITLPNAGYLGVKNLALNTLYKPFSMNMDIPHT